MGTTADDRNTRRWLGALGILSAVVAFALLAAGTDATHAQAPGRVIYMATIEPRGGAQIDKEPYSAAPLPAGPGYVKTPPDAAGRWEVRTYQWSPGTIVVRQGETVTLEIVGINGDTHPSTIPGLVDSFTVKRGEITRVTFTASKPGLYSVICNKHVPAMHGTLVVLPR